MDSDERLTRRPKLKPLSKEDCVPQKKECFFPSISEDNQVCRRVIRPPTAKQTAYERNMLVYHGVKPTRVVRKRDPLFDQPLSLPKVTEITL